MISTILSGAKHVLINNLWLSDLNDITELKPFIGLSFVVTSSIF